MPVPANLSELSTTAAANSPGGGDSPSQGDDYLRAFGAFIAQLRDKLNGTSATGTIKDPALSGTATGTLTGGTFASPTISDPTISNPTITGAIASPTLTNPTLNGSTSGSLRLSATGVPFGTALHNNAGAVTGATNQYIASGTYTPTAAGFSNVSSVSQLAATWMRVGNVVVVSGQCFANFSGAGSALWTLTLPIASTLPANTSLCGTVSPASSTITGARVSGSSNLAGFSATASGSGGTLMAFSFQYEVA